ncbi:MspA family porin [Nocardia sp. NPDC058499]|uniref:MspA family porin n=1 Tax=Nocardia sp. NPDC058499 TaxID=3346530 RepID=UPI003647779A
MPASSSLVTQAMGTSAAVMVSISLLSVGAATADTVVPLPDGQNLGSGVSITRTGEYATISPSLAGNGVGRVAWVSGIARAEVSVTPEGEVGPNSGPVNAPGTNNSSTHGASQLNTGYIVGCQVSIGEDAVSAGMSVSVDPSSVGVGGSVGISLGPGEVGFVQIDYQDITGPGAYSIEYRDIELQVQGCGGYAQARAYTVVEIIGDHYSKTTLYGAPFSIG